MKLRFSLVVLLFFGFSVAGVLAQDEEVVDEPTPEYSDQSCGECHLDYHAAWHTGVHAIAYDRESFQEAWIAEDKDPECLACHTTEYQPATQTYLAENIQCEACHGQTPANHPPAPFVVSTDAETCGDCHTNTFYEWERSLHAFTADMGAIGCATCHNPHGQNIREPDDEAVLTAATSVIDAMCLNCHQDDTNTYVHLTHNEIAFEGVEVTCASCHMYQQEADELHKLADHTMYVGTISCTDCHQEISLTGASPILIDVDSALAEERNELLARVEELQNELSLTEEEDTGNGDDYIRLTQGLIVGLGLGVSVLWVLMRRERAENNG